MQINESRKLLLSDTLVPDIFITEHLPALSGPAVKLYVFMLLVARTNRSINEQDLARRLGTDEESIRATLLELAARDLVQIRNRGVEIMDIKAAEIQRIYRPKTASTPTEITESQQKFDIREKLLADIAKTFFQGLMSPSWYGEIDTWFDRYKFEPEVIYALFQECARRNKLDSKAYISKVAENWAARGIITFADLNAYFLSYERISKTAKKVGRKLRRQMTEYDEEIVARWVDQFNYDFDIIDLALRKTTRLSNPNLEVVDRILTEWFSHQLRDVAAVKAYEANKAARFGKIGASAKGDAKAGNIGNFQQRNYTEDFLNEFYEDVTTGHAPPVENHPQQLELGDLEADPDVRFFSNSGEKERL
ncbi:MAG: DnaD domain protein [Saccharofermentanales bacterium]|jgi:DnaD/phage-associated family protein|nr:DnaD domain protein [Clostridiaceae bacterium]